MQIVIIKNMESLLIMVDINFDLVSVARGAVIFLPIIFPPAQTWAAVSQQANKPTEEQPAKGSNISETKHKALIITDGCHTHWISKGDERTAEERVSFFFWIQTCVCALWAAETILAAALISQPAQAGVKLIWKSSMRGRNMETHRRRGDAEHVGAHTGSHSADALYSCHLQAE